MELFRNLRVYTELKAIRKAIQQLATIEQQRLQLELKEAGYIGSLDPVEELPVEADGFVGYATDLDSWKHEQASQHRPEAEREG